MVGRFAIPNMVRSPEHSWNCVFRDVDSNFARWHWTENPEIRAAKKFVEILQENLRDDGTIVTTFNIK